MEALSRAERRYVFEEDRPKPAGQQTEFWYVNPTGRVQAEARLDATVATVRGGSECSQDLLPACIASRCVSRVVNFPDEVTGQPVAWPVNVEERGPWLEARLSSVHRSILGHAILSGVHVPEVEKSTLPVPGENTEADSRD